MIAVLPLCSVVLTEQTALGMAWTFDEQVSEASILCPCVWFDDLRRVQRVGCREACWSQGRLWMTGAKLPFEINGAGWTRFKVRPNQATRTGISVTDSMLNAPDPDSAWDPST